MKPSRPVLAAATAGALIAGSFAASESAPVFAPLVDATEVTANSDADTPETPEAKDVQEVSTTEEDTSDLPVEVVDEADVAEADAAETHVPEEIVQEAQSQPDHAAQAPAAAQMRKLTTPPRTASGGTQAWFATTTGADSHVEAWEVWSESMNRWIPVALIPATGPDKTTRIPNAPTLYMLNGAGGSEQNADWVNVGKAHTYFPGKGVNVVIPMEGAFSYYVDWLADGPELAQKSNYFKGAQKWTTFLGRELREPVENYLGADATKRGVVGMSMSATSSLLLAEHYPGEYQAVGSFSGCAATSTSIPWAFASLTVNRAAKNPNYASITPADIWGPMGSPYNRYNDALVNADKLAGSALYISNASGLAAEQDMYGYRRNDRGQSPSDALSGSMTTTIEGGVIEAATNACTHDLRAKLNSLNIPAHYEFKNAGTHSWPVWKDDMRRSWETVIGPALLGDKFVADSEELPDSSSWDADKSS